MLKLSLPAVIATVIATASPAFAEDQETLLAQFSPFTSAPGAFDEDKSQRDLFEADPAECFALVDKLRAAGIQDNDRFPLYPSGSWRFKNAKQLCEKYRSYQLKIQAWAIVEKAVEWEGHIEADSDASRAARDLEACVTGLDKLVGDGLPTDAVINVDFTNTILVSDAQKRCAQLLAKAKVKTEEADKERAARDAAVIAKWAKVGVTGDRLNILRAYPEMYIPGCQLTDDPKKLAKAKVLRLIFDNGDSLTIYVKSWHFKGNKLVKNTEQTWSITDKHRVCK